MKQQAQLVFGSRNVARRAATNRRIPGRIERFLKNVFDVKLSVCRLMYKDRAAGEGRDGLARHSRGRVTRDGSAEENFPSLVIGSRANAYALPFAERSGTSILPIA